jgi:hypothetical protein
LRLLPIKKRYQKLISYLKLLRIEAESNHEVDFSIAVINLADQIWKNLNDYFENESLEVPDACPGNDDNFMYTWSKDEHYLECEIFSNGAIEFFYRDRTSGEF